MPKRVIIDTDPGTDDAIAILLALSSPELIVEGITTVAGNVVTEQACQNALKIVSLAGRTQIPVALGARGPLVQELVTAGSHGETGLANSSLPEPSTGRDPRFGPDLIVELIHRHPGEVTLVALGPLTNLALALAQDPSIATLVREVVLMGGSVCGGNVDAVAEFNIFVDPEAASKVFEAGWPLTMVGLEIGRKALIRPEHVEALRSGGGALRGFAAEVISFLVERSCSRGFEGAPVYDATAMAAVIDLSLIRTELLRVDIELKGEFTRGQTVVNRRNARNRRVRADGHLEFRGTEPLNPNVHVALDIDVDRFLEFLIERL